MIPPVIVPVTLKEIACAIKDSAIGGRAKILEFEQEISKYNNCDHSILTYSGRTALYVLLKAYGLKKGDEVIMPSYMCETVSKMLLDMGFNLNFVDVNPNTYNMDIGDLNKKISNGTKAILAVHMFGIPCDMQAIKDLAQEYNSIVIEDAAQAMGAEYHGKKVGVVADAGFFSFGRGKPITAMGGGAIVTNDTEIDRKCRTIVNSFKEKSSYISTLIQLLGYSSLRNRDIYRLVYKKVRSKEFRINLHLDNLKYAYTFFQASIGISQFHKLDEFNSKRRFNAEILIRKLKNIDGISMPEVINSTKPIFLRLPIQIRNSVQRDRLMYLLEKHGVETSVVYPIPLPNLYNINTRHYAKYTGA